MNRRPSKSRTGYESFTPRHAARFTAATPDAQFFESRKKKPLHRQMLFFICGMLVFTLLCNLAVNQFVFVRRIEVPVRGLRSEFEGYTLLHISDLKGKSFGPDQYFAHMALNGKSFDAVVITGDMISGLGNAQPFYTLIERVRSINPDAPVYFIPGDSDPAATSQSYFPGGSPFAPWVLGAKQRGAHLLSSPAAVTRGEQTLWLTTGALLSLDIDTMQGQYEQQYLRALSSGDENEIELAVHNLSRLEETRAARAAQRPEDINIALSHTPPTPQDTWLSRTGLVLCGHYMAGLMRLPLIGPLFIPSGSLPRYGVFPGRSVHTGLRKEGGAWVYASPGLGASSGDYPSCFFRLFNPPTVTLLTLTPSSL